MMCLRKRWSIIDSPFGAVNTHSTYTNILIESLTDRFSHGDFISFRKKLENKNAAAAKPNAMCRFFKDKGSLKTVSSINGPIRQI